MTHKTDVSSDPRFDVPNMYDKWKHTRRAYLAGYENGRKSAPYAEDVAEYCATWIETPEDVAYSHAENSRDSGSARGLHRLNDLEEIAENGVTLSRFCENGDSCVMPVYGGISSGIANERMHLIDDVIEAYDSGFTAAFLENAERYE